MFIVPIFNSLPDFSSCFSCHRISCAINELSRGVVDAQIELQEGRLVSDD